VRILVLLTKPIAVVGPNSRVDTKVDAKNRNRIGIRLILADPRALGSAFI